MYSNLIYIVENKNGDIVIVDFLKYKVVLVDKLGEYWDYYKGWLFNKREFDLYGVCIDVYGYIIVVDYMFGFIYFFD